MSCIGSRRVAVGRGGILLAIPRLLSITMSLEEMTSIRHDRCCNRTVARLAWVHKVHEAVTRRVPKKDSQTAASTILEKG